VEGGAFAVMLGDAEPIPAALLIGGDGLEGRETGVHSHA